MPTSSPSPSSSDSSADFASALPHQVLLSLLNRPAYRRLWMQHVQRRRGSGINQRAVASFMAYELSDLLGQQIDPDTLKDRVARALKGTALSDATLHLFASAFGFTALEKHTLQQALSTQNLARKISQLAPSRATQALDPRSYTSLATAMEARIDPFGFIKDFTVTEIIRSDVDSLELIQPRVETIPQALTLLEGGQLVEVREGPSHTLHYPGNKVYQLAIQTPYPLGYGQIHQVSYRVKVDIDPLLRERDDEHYTSLGPFSPARFNTSMILTFDRPPQNMRQKFWNQKMHEERLIEDIPLPSQARYSATFPMIEDTVFAFSWEADSAGAIRHYHGQDPSWLSLLDSSSPSPRSQS
ncbi:MAG: hypothetical protein SOR40_01430 [Rothia sp. (in: high G+C Gram-positive bacteria)]|nr:hypothetical protein [Rothia sp. (in: high G+C Gram-positive bacteria)]